MTSIGELQQCMRMRDDRQILEHLHRHSIRSDKYTTELDVNQQTVSNSFLPNVHLRSRPAPRRAQRHGLHLERPVVSQREDLESKSQAGVACKWAAYSVGVMLEQIFQEAGLELIVGGGR